MLKILVVLFLLVLSLYTGLFMRAKIEDVKITDNIVDILLIPMKHCGDGILRKRTGSFFMERKPAGNRRKKKKKRDGKKSVQAVL